MKEQTIKIQAEEETTPNGARITIDIEAPEGEGRDLIVKYIGGLRGMAVQTLGGILTKMFERAGFDTE